MVFLRRLFLTVRFRSSRFRRFRSVPFRDLLLFQMWSNSWGAEQSWCEPTHIFSLWHFCLLSHKSLSMTPESGERCEGIIHPRRELPINLAVRRDSTSVSSGWSTCGYNSSQRWWCFLRLLFWSQLHGFFQSGFSAFQRSDDKRYLLNCYRLFINT